MYARRLRTDPALGPGPLLAGALLALLCGTGCASRSSSQVGPEHQTDARTHVPAQDAGLGWTAPPDGAAPTFAPTFYAVYYEILSPTCSSEFCHLNPGFFGLATPELAYRTLVGAKASSAACKPTGLSLIAPGIPDQSLVYLKLGNPPCGKRMPLGFATFTPLDPRKVEQLRQWILRGAPEVETTPLRDASIDAEAGDTSVDAAPLIDATRDAPTG